MSNTEEEFIEATAEFLCDMEAFGGSTENGDRARWLLNHLKDYGFFIGQWRPISEAKRDGTKYLVHQTDDEVINSLVIANWGWSGSDHTEGFWFVEGTYVINPTHFMSLPTPPKGGE